MRPCWVLVSAMADAIASVDSVSTKMQLVLVGSRRCALVLLKRLSLGRMLRCRICNVLSRSAAEHERHLLGKRHQRNLAEVEATEPPAEAGQPRKRRRDAAAVAAVRWALDAAPQWRSFEEEVCALDLAAPLPLRPTPGRRERIARGTRASRSRHEGGAMPSFLGTRPRGATRGADPKTL